MPFKSQYLHKNARVNVNRITIKTMYTNRQTVSGKDIIIVCRKSFKIKNLKRSSLNSLCRREYIEKTRTLGRCISLLLVCRTLVFIAWKATLKILTVNYCSVTLEFVIRKRRWTKTETVDHFLRDILADVSEGTYSQYCLHRPSLFAQTRKLILCFLRKRDPTTFYARRRDCEE